jgi:hypothetical protein
MPAGLAPMAFGYFVAIKAADYTTASLVLKMDMACVDRPNQTSGVSG